MDTIEALKRCLANHPELRFRTTRTSVEIDAPSSDGFTVGLRETSNDYVIHFEGWHEHCRSGDEALACIAFAYSGECRLAITYRGRMPVKWVVESLEDGKCGGRQ